MTAEIVAIRKGDGHPHLSYDGSKTLCGRIPKPNNWAHIQVIDPELTVRLTAATLTRPWSLESVCVRCIRAVGLGDEYDKATRRTN
ncbi:hypothetical protein ACR5MH_0755 (plasmid) [Streptomyces sp. L7]|uniref:hypothetical protein n=1 Tax=Streptomyces sp. L7 TaxID=3423954 RepID=UPI000E1FD204|nr:hypothetical protein DOE76_15150 [Leifsonia sp. ku-ls]